MKQRAESSDLPETKLSCHAGGSIREYLAGSPGPPGPPGAPGAAGDGLVDDVANRVLAYIQSMNSYIIMLHLLLHMIVYEHLQFLTENITFTYSGSGRRYDGTPGPAGPPGPPGSISVNDIINLLQRKSHLSGG